MNKLTEAQRKKISKGLVIAADVVTAGATIASVVMLGKSMKDGDAKKITGFGALSVTSAVLLATSISVTRK